MAYRPARPQPHDDKQASAAFERKITRARFVMVLEQIWPRLWLPLGIIGLFVLASTFGLWPALPKFAHITLFAVFVAGLLLSFAPALKIRRPDRTAAIRWLEKKSGLAHRPATTLDDELSQSAEAPTNSLWQAHKKRARNHVAAMKTGIPAPRTARFDPYALRVPLMLALAATIGLQSHAIFPGISDALRFDKAQGLNDLRIDAWITPPSYTASPPVVLVNGAKPLESEPETNDEAAKLIKVPEMSQLVVRVSGPNASNTRLTLHQPSEKKSKTGVSAKATTKVETRQDGAVHDIRTKLMQSISAKLHRGRRHIRTWHFAITPDHPPAITFTKKPQATKRGSLRLSYRVTDDYGVVKATAHISKTAQRLHHPGKIPGTLPPLRSEQDQSLAPSSQVTSSPAPDNLMLPLGEPPTFPLLLPRGNTKKGSANTYKDLTAHPWAGLDVEMVLHARDQSGKTGKSLVTRFKLPARQFTKPLARAVIKVRRHLVERPFDHRKIAGTLDMMTNVPLNDTAKTIKDKGIFLGLRTAYWRLSNASKRQTIRSVVDQLWDIALTIEDGNLSKAERELRSAQDRLMDALSKNASEEEIAKLMKELRQALNKFMQAMAKQQQNQPQNADQQQPGDQRTMSAKELDKMLRDIENMAKTGSRDAAKQMLSQLREMLENLNSGRPQPSAKSQQMRKQLDELGKMIMQQRRLLDETHKQNQQQGQRRQGQRQGQQRGRNGQKGQRQGQQQGQGQGLRDGQGQDGQGQKQGQGQNNQQGNGSGGQTPRAGTNGLKQRQGQLLDGLNDLMDQMGQGGTRIPQDLMRAGSNMGQAESQLGRQKLGPAGRQQGKALDNLRKGATELAEQMRRNARGQGQQSRGQNRDPLGRPQRTNGPDFGDDVKVPREIDTRRARDILEELRRRLGQSTRPTQELDYLERLIEQF